MQDLVAIESTNVKMRAVLAVAVLSALVFGWFAIRWQMGNMLANLTRVGDPNASEIAAIAANWAPSDPTAYSLKASTSEDATAAIQALEIAVRLSPFDYRWRTELGRAFEQDGQAERAEIEFKKAVELAPSYAAAHWHLGNFYLRRERNEEAIAELKRAAENHRDYRDQVFLLAWDFFNKDAFQVETLASDRTEVRVHLAYFFAARGRAEDSLRNWNRLSDPDKAKNVSTARPIALGLFDQRHFSEALEFSKQYGADSDAKAEMVTNGSFEMNIGEPEDSRFGWLILRNDPKIEIIADSRVKREGTRSLKMTFKGYAKPSLANLFQTVVVVPGKKYTLRFWVRTENLRSAGLPLIEILNGNDDKMIARSPVYPAGTNDWQEIIVDFAAPVNCGGISIRTIRAACGEDCPINGILWYDDFEMSVQP